MGEQGETIINKCHIGQTIQAFKKGTQGETNINKCHIGQTINAFKKRTDNYMDCVGKHSIRMQE